MTMTKATAAAAMRKGSFPVIHILSPSPLASRKFRDHLANLFGWIPVDDDHGDMNNDVDWNDRAFGMSRFGSTSKWIMPQWDFVALQCPQTKCQIQWIAMNHRTSSNTSRIKHELLGILETPTTKNLSLSSLCPRQQLAESIRQVRSSSSSLSISLVLQSLLWKHISPSLLLGQDKHGRDNTMLFNLGARAEADDATTWDSDVEEHYTKSPPSSSLGDFYSTSNTLKEVAIPTNPEDHLMQQLADSCLSRPVPGLYQHSASGLCIRPLPSAPGDQSLSPPSLVFHVDNEDSQQTLLDSLVSSSSSSSSSNALQISTIGRTGAQDGQVLLRHDDWKGLDVRLCSATRLVGMFNEAQESLLAGSMQELQSIHVLKGAHSGTEDPKTERMDCWVEFRTVLRKNPMGFVNGGGRRPARASSSWSTIKTAKAPDLPPE